MGRSFFVGLFWEICFFDVFPKGGSDLSKMLGYNHL